MLGGSIRRKFLRLIWSSEGNGGVIYATQFYDIVIRSFLHLRYKVYRFVITKRRTIWLSRSDVIIARYQKKKKKKLRHDRKLYIDITANLRGVNMLLHAIAITFKQMPSFMHRISSQVPKIAPNTSSHVVPYTINVNLLSSSMTNEEQHN